MPLPAAASKQQIRRQVRWLRDSHFDATRTQKSQTIAAHVMAWIAQRNLTHIGLYASMGSEVQTQDLIQHLCLMGKVCWLPKVQGPTMTFHSTLDGLDLVKGPYGIAEPTSTQAAKKLDLLLVPALSVDSFGHRLGYGKGYYDRFIQTTPAKHTMALVYECQVRAKLPFETHDQPLQWIATERGIRHVF
jgi:5-formyltetrahydrofolate cyclo-ligase